MTPRPFPSRRARRFTPAVGALVSLTLVLAACGKVEPEAGPASEGRAPAEHSWSDADAGKAAGAPTITQPRGDAPSKLQIDDVTTGTGDAVSDGSVALVDYIGANFSNGKVFDTSFGRAPFPVSVGMGKVIEGWDRGLIGMKVGGKRQLVIPPALGYGAQSQGDIGANETLIFIIELRAVLQRPTPTAVPGGTVTQLVSTDTAPGFGDAAVKAGDKVSVHYVGVHGSNGELFDASWDRGEPITIQVGQGQVIQGWDQGLLGMKVGGRRHLEIPADLAYGAQGRPPTIQPNETLVFDVDVVGIG